MRIQGCTGLNGCCVADRAQRDVEESVHVQFAYQYSGALQRVRLRHRCARPTCSSERYRATCTSSSRMYSTVLSLRMSPSTCAVTCARSSASTCQGLGWGAKCQGAFEEAKGEAEGA